MNEKIKELVNQATIYTKQYKKEMIARGYYHDNDMDIFNDKFSELIVCECINKLSEWDIGIDNPLGESDITSQVARDMILEIKELFGVKNQ
jgi:hypothetical protein